MVVELEFETSSRSVSCFCRMIGGWNLISNKGLAICLSEYRTHNRLTCHPKLSVRYLTIFRGHSLLNKHPSTCILNSVIAHRTKLDRLWSPYSRTPKPVRLPDTNRAGARPKWNANYLERTRHTKHVRFKTLQEWAKGLYCMMLRGIMFVWKRHKRPLRDWNGAREIIADSEFPIGCHAVNTHYNQSGNRHFLAACKICCRKYTSPYSIHALPTDNIKPYDNLRTKLPKWAVCTNTICWDCLTESQWTL